MRVYYKISVFFLALMLFAGCHETTTGDIAKVTYYVTFDMTGDAQYLLPKGTPYVEPGVKALENGEDISSKMTTTGTIDINKVGFYDLTYTASNVDGFSSSTKRTVIVYDPTITADISGKYSVDLTYSNRFQFSNSAVVKYSKLYTTYGKGDFSTYEVTITKFLPGIYTVSDFFGGYYVEGRGYAATYAMTGYFSLNPDNTIDLLSSHIEGWGDALDALKNASFDPVTNSLQWGAEYGGSYSFNVKLNKK